MSTQPVCVHCGIEMPGASPSKMYCSRTCKRAFRAINPPERTDVHPCRMCGAEIPIGPGQGNRWLCSPECRRASVAKSVREFHLRRPEAEAIYRERTKQKKLPDSNLVRFYRHNPKAPRACQSCGESRVLDVAHRPGSERFGEWRSRANTVWPQMVWVLCPTCHMLLDRMNYSPKELGLK